MSALALTLLVGVALLCAVLLVVRVKPFDPQLKKPRDWNREVNDGERHKPAEPPNTLIRYGLFGQTISEDGGKTWRRLDCRRKGGDDGR